MRHEDLWFPSLGLQEWQNRNLPLLRVEENADEKGVGNSLLLSTLHFWEEPEKTHAHSTKAKVKTPHDYTDLFVGPDRSLKEMEESMIMSAEPC